MAQVKFSVAIQNDAYKNLINRTLGDPEVARKFVAEISTVVSQNPQLQTCDAGSIISAGLLAQTVGLSLSPSLGLAYVVPYKDKAQFQVGWKGLTQLAMRSGQMAKVGTRAVHDGEWVGQDEFGDDEFRFSHEFDSKPVIGYFAYFVLTNGFKKTFYMTKEQVEQHARRYSKAYAANWSGNLWKDQFDLMAQKTVLKLLLNRYAPLSIEMQKVIQADQAVVKRDGSYEYVDNEPEPVRRSVTNTILPEKEGADQDGVIAIADEDADF